MTAQILSFPVRRVETVSSEQNDAWDGEKLSPATQQKVERLRQLISEAVPIRRNVSEVDDLLAKVNARLPAGFDPGIAKQIAEVLREALKDAVPVPAR